MRLPRANVAVASAFSGVAILMVGLSFAAVPLYRLFCASTGYGGTPKIGASASPGAVTETIGIRFDANVNPALPWNFKADLNEITLPLGEERIAFYRARNLTESPITGVAVYNVTPEKAAQYFHKTACFCFDQQTLQGGQSMEFPLSFWVDPQIAKDPATADVRVVTLSYTFFRSLADAANTEDLKKAGPHVGRLSTDVGSFQTRTN